MKILITGSHGFLGTLLVKDLHEKHDLLCYDIINGDDITDPVRLRSAFQNFKPQTVIHLAAVSNLNLYHEDHNLGYKINITGTRNILNLCQEFHSRLLFASTCCCYGNNGIHPSDETSPLTPTEPYAQSKEISEKDVQQAGLPHCCMRFATFYGPNMRGSLSQGIFIDKIYRQEKIEIHGTGLQTRTYTYVDDIVKGIIAILESAPQYTVINITDDTPYSVLDTIRLLEKTMKKKAQIKFIKDRSFQILKEDISNQRLRSLGWKPETRYAEGLEKSYQFYLNNGGKWNLS